MDTYKFELESGAIIGTYRALAMRIDALPETRAVGAWRQPDGTEFLVASGPDEEAIAQIAEDEGLAFRLTETLNPVEPVEVVGLFPIGHRYCPLCEEYHPGAPCG